MLKRIILLLFATLMSIQLIGCAHELEVKNINDYRLSSITSLNKKISIAIIPDTTDYNDRIIIRNIASELSKYASKVVMPENGKTSKETDKALKIGIKHVYSGSWANFPINFPGFLIWAPALNGYVYHQDYEIVVEDVSNDIGINKKLSIPIHLNIRHADASRTWTEVSWLEVGVIAFVGGAVFVSYDNDITTKTIDSTRPVLSDYIAQKVIAFINQNG